MLVFFDLEVNTKTKKIDLIGAVTEKDKRFEANNEADLFKFIKKNKGKYLVGHNIVNHDLKYLNLPEGRRMIDADNVIDTLLLSTLLFSNEPYHELVKDDKLHSGTLNNPVNDSISARRLFFDIVNKFNSLEEELQNIYYLLLNNVVGFRGFFNYLNFKSKETNLFLEIKKHYKGKICENFPLNVYIGSYPVELAYVLSLINTNEKSVLPQWVLYTYPNIDKVITATRNTPCSGCEYCDNRLNSEKGLHDFFGYEKFRSFDGVELQKDAVDAALKGESLIAVFPTGGGKSLAFQLPALMDNKNTRGLTVVISPLQSLMKDQVDNLAKENINSAVAISGLLDPIERKKSLQRVASGEVGLLYIAPESLRNDSIERILLKRKITRIVIDEAHCFSTWGHDFRVDYLYIAEFIKNLQTAKGLKNPIPISCFTATAKIDVIEDIKIYFKERLNLDLKEFTTRGTRTNLTYSVKKVEDDAQKFEELRRMLLEKDTPTIIYCSRVKTVEDLHNKLYHSGFKATKFHGRLDKEEKILNQEKFMHGDVNIMIATSAFGMGVNKDNVERVFHYEISDSLENYVQEAGRAGRDDKITAHCHIFFQDEDLNKHFELLNLSKLNKAEISQLWRGIKEATKTSKTISKSTLELATDSGWNERGDIDTKVKAAVSTLEEVGYIKRHKNKHYVFADSLLSKSVNEAKKKMEDSKLFDSKETILANRIIQHLISRKYKSLAGTDVAEGRVDYLADLTGASKQEIVKIINKFREIEILANDKDLYAHIKSGSTSIGPMRILTTFKEFVDAFLLNFEKQNSFHLNFKKFKADLEAKEINMDINTLKRFVNYFELARLTSIDKMSRDDIEIQSKYSKTEFEKLFERRLDLAEKILSYLYKEASKSEIVKKENLLPFSLIGLKKQLNKEKGFLTEDYQTEEVEDAINLLTRIDALKIEGGFLVLYSPLNLEKTETNPLKQYTEEDYESLGRYYKTKKEQIHIVGEYANKMSIDQDKAQEYVNDYFNIEYKEFIEKYFPGNKKRQLDINMTVQKYNELFGSLSKEQKEIINDSKNKRIGVTAGPGSGKTKLLVHKLASILYTEDTKTNELLMLTFSRSAAIEFKERLYNLIGDVASFVTITTFHSFAFDIMESLGNEEKFDSVIKEATIAINDKNVDYYKVNRSVLVIDEAQDMTQEEYEFVEAIISFNSDIRIIAVGDDDQNIFQWRGSSSKYLKNITEAGKSYELTVNYRSKKNLVEFANLIANNIEDRQKKGIIKAYTKELGTIQATNYKTDNIITPLVEQIKLDNLEGKTCVIVKTNDEAALITGLLNKEGIKASLIQDYDNFRLYDMKEIRTFYKKVTSLTDARIDKKIIDEALKSMKRSHYLSSDYEFAKKAILKLISDTKELFLFDLNSVLFETYYYDIYEQNKVVVATFHKAKGKQFDNVYIMNNDKKLIKDDERRLFYVGVTRAKTNLRIHSKMNYKSLKLSNFTYYENNNDYQEPDYIEMLFNHADLNLWMSALYQRNLSEINTGVELTIDEKNNLIHNDKKLARLSERGIRKVQNNLDKGFKLIKTTLNHQVYWYNQEKKEDVLLALPKLTFKKGDEVKD